MTKEDFIARPDDPVIPPVFADMRRRQREQDWKLCLSNQMSMQAQGISNLNTTQQANAFGDLLTSLFGETAAPKDLEIGR